MTDISRYDISFGKMFSRRHRRFSVLRIPKMAGFCFLDQLWTNLILDIMIGCQYWPPWALDRSPLATHYQTWVYGTWRKGGRQICQTNPFLSIFFKQTKNLERNVLPTLCWQYLQKKWTFLVVQNKTWLHICLKIKIKISQNQLLESMGQGLATSYPW